MNSHEKLIAQTYRGVSEPHLVRFSFSLGENADKYPKTLKELSKTINPYLFNEKMLLDLFTTRLNDDQICELIKNSSLVEISALVHQRKDTDLRRSLTIRRLLSLEKRHGIEYTKKVFNQSKHKDWLDFQNDIFFIKSSMDSRKKSRCFLQKTISYSKVVKQCDFKEQLFALNVGIFYRHLHPAARKEFRKRYACLQREYLDYLSKSEKLWSVFNGYYHLSKAHDSHFFDRIIRLCCKGKLTPQQKIWFAQNYNVMSKRKNWKSEVDFILKYPELISKDPSAREVLRTFKKINEIKKIIADRIPEEKCYLELPEVKNITFITTRNEVLQTANDFKNCLYTHYWNNINARTTIVFVYETQNIKTLFMIHRYYLDPTNRNSLYLASYQNYKGRTPLSQVRRLLTFEIRRQIVDWMESRNPKLLRKKKINQQHKQEVKTLMEQYIA